MEVERLCIYVCISQRISGLISKYYTLCSIRKRQLVYLHDVFVGCCPILLIFGRNTPEGICNKHIYTSDHISFGMFALYHAKTSNDCYVIQYSVKYEVSILIEQTTAKQTPQKNLGKFRLAKILRRKSVAYRT